MSIKDFFSGFFNSKASEARIVSSFQQVGRAQPTEGNYENYSRLGYARNAITHACISKIAQSSGGIKWRLYSKKKNGERTEISESPLLTLINRPNPMQSQSSFIEAVVGFYQLTGNTYIEAVKAGDGTIMELYPVRPDRMRIVPGKNGFPSQYVFTAAGNEKVWNVDFVKLKSDILHIKTFNPLNDWYGMSPLQAAILSLDQNNEASLWNLSLLRNSATPSGVLQMKASDANPRGELTTEQYKRLKDEFETAYTGAKNTGRPLLLEGGLNWTTISLSPKDMDFLQSKNITAQDIAMVYGVPLEILGLGQKTFTNYAEARCSFYEETVLPVMDLVKGELNRWLAPSFGDDLELDYDKDDIEALEPKRKTKYDTVKDATFLTLNEKREAVGYEQMEGCDVFVIGSVITMNPEEEANADVPDETQDPNGEDVPKKPTADTEKPDSEEVDAQDDDNALNSDEEGKDFKSFNLLNANEKRKSWKKQNRLRKSLQAPFTRDLDYDFTKMNLDIADGAKLQDPRLAEIAMHQAISTHMVKIKSTLEKNIDHTLRTFGRAIFDQGKSAFGEAIETKAKQSRFDQFVSAYVEKHAGEAITKIEGTTNKQVKRIVRRLVEQNVANGEPNADLANELFEDLQSISKGRARTIARTEVSIASTKGNLEAAKALQVPGMIKEWVSADDDRVRDDDAHADHAAMNGQTVEIDEKFTVPPDADMDGPCDPSAPAEQVINCRCVVTFRAGRPNG